MSRPLSFRKRRVEANDGPPTSSKDTSVTDETTATSADDQKPDTPATEKPSVLVSLVTEAGLHALPRDPKPEAVIAALHSLNRLSRGAS